MGFWPTAFLPLREIYGRNHGRGLKAFLAGFQGLEQNQFLHNIGTAYFFFIITFVLNVLVIYYGIEGGYRATV
jgi:hypothetical protein